MCGRRVEERSKTSGGWGWGHAAGKRTVEAGGQDGGRWKGAAGQFCWTTGCLCNNKPVSTTTTTRQEQGQRQAWGRPGGMGQENDGRRRKGERARHKQREGGHKQAHTHTQCCWGRDPNLFFGLALECDDGEQGSSGVSERGGGGGKTRVARAVSTRSSHGHKICGEKNKKRGRETKREQSAVVDNRGGKGGGGCSLRHAGTGWEGG